VNKPRRALGRGLDALIPAAETRAGAADIPVARISPNPHQPRQSIDEESLAELVASIREHGVIQPLIVTQVGDEYQLIAGERRWRAAQLAGLVTLPALVKETTPQQMLELALVENLQRADLNPLEEAGAYRELIDEFGLTQEQVAGRVGKSRTAVANTLRLLRLPEEVKQALAAGRISEGHARALLALPSGPLQRQALGIILQRGLNVRQTEELVRRMQAEAPEAGATTRPLSPQDRDAVDKFQARLGTKVNLVRSKQGGRLVIHFYSEEELQAIYEAIVGEQ
jgi:ParB family chromosome partitioning protein